MTMFFYIFLAFVSATSVLMFNGESKAVRAYIALWGALSVGGSINMIKSGFLSGDRLLSTLVVGYGIIAAVLFLGMLILFALEYKETMASH